MRCIPLELAAGNQTPDSDVDTLANAQNRVVITKDADFVDSHLLRGRPRKLLLISTGNITNDELEATFTPLISDIAKEFDDCQFIELGQIGWVVRG